MRYFDGRPLTVGAEANRPFLSPNADLLRNGARHVAPVIQHAGRLRS
jgi:hypothetical protein